MVDLDAGNRLDFPVGVTAGKIVHQPLAVSFPRALTGPLDRGQSYSLSTTGGPPGAGYRLVVDGDPVGTQGPTLPAWVPTGAGRHTVAVEAATAARTDRSDPIAVYVLGDVPPTGYRVNLAAVASQPENWLASLQRYDELVAAGHSRLQLFPSPKGFWNLFVPGFGDDADGARAYCISYGLQIPSQCFAGQFDPNA